MVGNSFGRIFRVTTCGESYAGGFRKNPDIPKELYGGLMTIVDGVPPGIKLTSELIQEELDKENPANQPWIRQEKNRTGYLYFPALWRMIFRPVHLLE